MFAKKSFKLLKILYQAKGMDSITLYTSVNNNLLKDKLFKGTLKASVSIILLLIPTIFFTKEFLQYSGIVFFITFLYILHKSLMPYRTLQKLEKNPLKLILEEDKASFCLANKNIIIPYQGIERILYKDIRSNYGIEISMFSKEKIFLPYFSKYAFEEMQSIYMCFKGIGE
ncbi:hypothetical protein BN1013_00516 [Candidatus Rubidus massiliensis]|nr:hypothetical protein BN1013_00516 [Candidatus Rubidus massiliensis]